MIFLEYLTAEVDQQIKFLRENSDSEDPNINFLELWKKTFQARKERFTENKKLKKVDEYMSYKSLQSEDGGPMVG